MFSNLRTCSQNVLKFDLTEKPTPLIFALSQEQRAKDRKAEAQWRHTVQKQQEGHGDKRRRRQRDRSRSRSPVVALIERKAPSTKAVVTAAKKIIDHSKSVSACPSGSTSQMMKKEDSQVVFRLSHVRIIHDALVRASMASEQLSEVMKAFDAQNEVERKVISQAKDLLGQYLVEASQV